MAGLEKEVRKKNEHIRSYEEEISRIKTLSTRPSAPLSDSQAKNKLMEDNNSLRQSLFQLGGELTNCKNDKINL